MNDSKALTMTRAEKRVALILGAVFGLRMLGLFMLIPVLALHAETLAGATPLLIGLAIGVYGLTQALFQIPLGALSDRVGRRPVILGGLLVFTFGALLGAVADSVWPVVAARAIQGAGAISGATLALAADLSRANQRSKMMAIIGVFIGGSFSLAFVLGPWLHALWGLSGLFCIAAGLAAAAMALVVLTLPASPSAPGASPGRDADTGAKPQLRMLYLGVFALHLILAASFVAIPIALSDGAGVSPARHYTIYLPVLLVSLAIVAPLIARSARIGDTRLVIFRAIAAIGIAEILIHVAWHEALGLCAALVLFFVGFNYLEASLPGYVSRAAAAGGRGKALGAYATCQFLGVFCGGLGGGMVAEHWDFNAVPVACALLALLWFALSWRAAPLSSARPP